MKIKVFSLFFSFLSFYSLSPIESTSSFAMEEEEFNPVILTTRPQYIEYLKNLTSANSGDYEAGAAACRLLVKIYTEGLYSQEKDQALASKFKRSEILNIHYLTMPYNPTKVVLEQALSDAEAKLRKELERRKSETQEK